MSQIAHSILRYHQRNYQGILSVFCQRYRDRLEEHINNLAANLVKARDIEDRQDSRGRDLQIY